MIFTQLGAPFATPGSWDGWTTYAFTTDPAYGDSSYPGGYRDLWSPTVSVTHPPVPALLRRLEPAASSTTLLAGPEEERARGYSIIWSLAFADRLAFACKTRCTAVRVSCGRENAMTPTPGLHDPARCRAICVFCPVLTSCAVYAPQWQHMDNLDHIRPDTGVPQMNSVGAWNLPGRAFPGPSAE